MQTYFSIFCKKISKTILKSSSANGILCYFWGMLLYFGIISSSFCVILLLIFSLESFWLIYLAFVLQCVILRILRHSVKFGSFHIIYIFLFYFSIIWRHFVSFASFLITQHRTLIMRHLASSCVILRRFASFCIILRHLASFCVVLHHFTSFCISLHHFASFCLILHHFASFYVILHHFASFLASFLGWSRAKHSLPYLGQISSCRLNRK